MRQLQQLMGGLSGGRCEAFSWVFIPLMSSESSGYFSLRHFPAPSHAAHLSILGGVRKKWSLWWHPTQLGKLDSHAHSRFPLREKLWARNISLGIDVGYLVEVGALIGSSEGNLSYPLQCVTFQNFISFIIQNLIQKALLGTPVIFKSMKNSWGRSLRTIVIDHNLVISKKKFNVFRLSSKYNLLFKFMKLCVIITPFLKWAR